MLKPAPFRLFGRFGRVAPWYNTPMPSEPDKASWWQWALLAAFLVTLVTLAVTGHLTLRGDPAGAIREIRPDVDKRNAEIDELTDDPNF